MCFSATASFATGGLLTLIGGLCIAKAKKTPLVAFSAIPLFFALQQLAEGVVWSTLTTNPSMMATIAASIFIFFAYIFWPVWIPFSLMLFEPNHLRKKMLFLLTIISALSSCFFLFSIMHYGVIASSIGNHLVYNASSDASVMVPYYLSLKFLYLALTILPFFISSFRIIQIMGLAALGSYITTEFFYSAYLTSVWCFFAAALSIFIYVVVSSKIIVRSHDRN